MSVCVCILLEKAVSHGGHSSFKPSHNYMVVDEGVGAKLAEQPEITEGKKELVQWGAQLCCPGASV